MVWVVAITCVSLSCEPIPIITGWFDSEEDCTMAAAMIMDSWNPDIGYYKVKCRARSVI